MNASSFCSETQRISYLETWLTRHDAWYVAWGTNIYLRKPTFFLYGYAHLACLSTCCCSSQAGADRMTLSKCWISRFHLIWEREKERDVDWIMAAAAGGAEHHWDQGLPYVWGQRGNVIRDILFELFLFNYTDQYIFFDFFLFQACNPLRGSFLSSNTNTGPPPPCLAAAVLYASSFHAFREIKQAAVANWGGLIKPRDSTGFHNFSAAGNMQNITYRVEIKGKF
jgi:hypothetical protein